MSRGDRLLRVLLAGAALSSVLRCAGSPGEPRPPSAGPLDVVVTEIASSNPGGGPGAARDDYGDYDDWIELYNRADHDVDLSGLRVSDFGGHPDRYRLPEGRVILLPKRSYLLLFADGETHQGPRHLPFGLDREGESVVISTSDGVEIGRTDFPEMKEGQSFALDESGAFRVCDTPTPGAANVCKAKDPPAKKEYAPYAWPDVWPPSREAPIVIAEIDPFGETVTSNVPWIELHNRASRAIDLGTLSIRVALIVPPEPLPVTPVGEPIRLEGVLAPGGRALVPVPSLPSESAVVLVFGPDGTLWDRAAYESPQPGTVLALPPDGRGILLGCDAQGATPGGANAPCVDPPPRASSPAMLRTIASRADLDAMAGPLDETTSDAASVKFIIDRQAGNAVYFVDSARWSLHFDWVWEVIEKRAPFDLCDRDQNQRHHTEWVRFSQENYFAVDTRRYFLGTLIYYRDSGLYTVEFAAGDRISPEMVRETFFLVAKEVFSAKEIQFRPTTSRLEGVALQLEGTLPIVPAEEPFEGQTLQTLNPAVGYGVLQVVRAEEIESAPLSFQSIAILDRIVDDIPPVSGTITEEFQTPLAHVNVLAQNRGTPNMALKSARSDPRIAPFIGRLVRFEVTSSSFDLRVASSTEAEDFWRRRFESRPVLVPERDLSFTSIVDLRGRSFRDVSRIGAKAAQFAELSNMSWPRFASASACALSGVAAQIPVPRPAFAIPFARYVDHLTRNGIDAEIAAFLGDLEAKTNPALRREALARIRDHIEAAPVDPEFLADLTAVIRQNFGQDRVRFRSSTNVEDLPGFNGAGLYESGSAQLGSEVRGIEDVLRKVWASAWTFRGYEERALFGVEEGAVAMGVLVHRGFPSEEANGVAITRNIVAPDSHGFYINAQVGELSVVLPETGDLPEQLLYKMFSPPDVVVLARSTATGGVPVLESAELHRLACLLDAIHNRFREHYRGRIPEAEFAVDVEFKLDGSERQIFVKQARPWVPAARVEPTTCKP